MNIMPSSELLEIIFNSYDELFIYDNNYNIVYANSAVERHYGYKPEEMIGKTYFDFFQGNSWDVSILPYVYENKKPIAINQTTRLNVELLTIAVPIFDDEDNIEYVIMNVRDKASDIELYNPSYNFNKDTNMPPSPVFESAIMADLLALMERVAQTNATVILTGETGTGKTLFANHIHKASPRRDKPFIGVNCANISNELFESELFGYSKGAFTGASTKGKDGLFLASDKGTLFLDEISELSLSCQAKLLTVLQESRFIPVGSTKYIDIDVRIIAATNKNLGEMVKLNTFREDLYYRLNLIEIYIPPLRNRKEDIPLLIEHFSKETYRKYKIQPKFSEETIGILLNNSWKGNVRELQYTIERLALTTNKDIIEPKDLPSFFFEIQDDNFLTIHISDASLDSQVDQLKRALTIEAYKKHNTSRKLAEYLQISQSVANNLIRKYIKEENI